MTATLAWLPLSPLRPWAMSERRTVSALVMVRPLDCLARLRALVMTVNPYPMAWWHAAHSILARRSVMCRRVALIIIALGIAGPHAPGQGKAVVLFDGKTFDGW